MNEHSMKTGQKGTCPAVEMISPKDANALASRETNVVLLDVRTPAEFSEVHIENSVNIPQDMLAKKIEELRQSGRTYIVYCRAGHRSLAATNMMMQAGISSVKMMEGGIERWQKDRLAVVKGKKVISLEGQVRIAAGFLMLLGIVLAGFVHTAFILISIFVACGLIFAGLTNTCMMGKLLMKLPYNKCK